MEVATITKTKTLKAPLYISVNCSGYSFIVIYGKLFKGYYCSILNWGICINLACPSNILQNSNQLANGFMGIEGNDWESALALEIGKSLSLAIKEACDLMRRKNKYE
ncbi:MAG: hypothetical protein ACLRVU_09580 [Beduini sp.]|uniref:hypothetical protein n=1 Tax=Beduini sp. TaxID=1922300 RepID=UPI0039A20604